MVSADHGEEQVTARYDPVLDWLDLSFEVMVRHTTTVAPRLFNAAE